MQPPPLFSSRARRTWPLPLLVAPAALGVLTGVALGLAAEAFLLLNVVAVVGGVLAGFEHLRARAGAFRGVLGGAVFGAFILLTHSALGVQPRATLPSPLLALVSISASVGAVLGALGALLRARLGRDRG